MMPPWLPKCRFSAWSPGSTGACCYGRAPGGRLRQEFHGVLQKNSTEYGGRGAGVALLVGVDIGGTKTAVVAGRATGGSLEVLDRVSFPTDPRTRAWREVLSDVAAAATRLAGRSMEAVGVSCGG